MTQTLTYLRCNHSRLKLVVLWPMGRTTDRGNRTWAGYFLWWKKTADLWQKGIRFREWFTTFQFRIILWGPALEPAWNTRWGEEFSEGPKIFKLCPIFLNYVQPIFAGGGAKNFRGLHPLRLPWIRSWWDHLKRSSEKNFDCVTLSATDKCRDPNYFNAGSKLHFVAYVFGISSVRASMTSDITL